MHRQPNPSARYPHAHIDEMTNVANLPRSPLLCLLSERRSLCGKPRENTVLINRHRNAKSLSPSGNVQMACRCSGDVAAAVVGHAGMIMMGIAALNPSYG